VVNLRIGNVLDPEGGYLGGLLPLYRWLGGWMWGDSDAAIPWISRADAIGMIGFALANERWYGPLNVVAPEAITHRDLALAMSERLGRRAAHQVPAFFTRAILGEFASAIMDDQRVVPAKALGAGFTYQHQVFETWMTETFAEAPSGGYCQPAGVR
jgi:NAD dependent epimerase/dehydratase family enzyme